MKKEKRSVDGRYVSVEKIQQMLCKIGAEICEGRKRVRVGRSGDDILIFTNGGAVNISFSEEGGAE